MTVKLVGITLDTPQEELADIGCLILMLEKDQAETGSEPWEFLRNNYYPWFLQLAKPYAANPVIVFRAIFEQWPPYRIAQELGVTIPGLPQM